VEHAILFSGSSNTAAPFVFDCLIANSMRLPRCSMMDSSPSHEQLQRILRFIRLVVSYGSDLLYRMIALLHSRKSRAPHRSIHSSGKMILNTRWKPLL
jgi:hypothetical protein